MPSWVDESYRFVQLSSDSIVPDVLGYLTNNARELQDAPDLDNINGSNWTFFDNLAYVWAVDSSGDRSLIEHTIGSTSSSSGALLFYFIDSNGYIVNCNRIQISVDSNDISVSYKTTDGTIISAYSNNQWSSSQYQKIYIENLQPSNIVSSDLSFIVFMWNNAICDEVNISAPSINFISAYRTNGAIDSSSGEYELDEGGSYAAITIIVSFLPAPLTQQNRFYFDKPTIRDTYYSHNIENVVWLRRVSSVDGFNTYESVDWGNFEPQVGETNFIFRALISDKKPQNRYDFKVAQSAHDSNGDIAQSAPAYASLEFGDRRVFPIAEGYMQGQNDELPVHIAFGMYEDENGNAKGTIYSDGASKFTIGDKGTSVDVFDDFFTFDYENGLSVKAQNSDISYQMSSDGLNIKNGNSTIGSISIEENSTSLNSSNAILSNYMSISDYGFFSEDKGTEQSPNKHLSLKYLGK